MGLTSVAANISILLALVANNAHVPEYREHDLLVRNIVWKNGKVSLDQVGGMDYVEGELHWQWWKFTKDVGEPYKFNGKYVILIKDKESKKSYFVIAPVYVVYGSLTDLEVKDRESFPVECRRKLK